MFILILSGAAEDRGLFKRIQPRHIHSCYQQMNIMCAFISDHTFQIHQPIMRIHSVTTAGAATTIAFATVWRSRTTTTTTHLLLFTVLKN